MIAACVKWVDGLGEPGDDRFAGISPADQAALELALQQAAAAGVPVTVVTVGPAAAERALRDALACGATDAVRIDGSTDLSSAVVAELLATVVASAGWIWCGDYSSDRGTGSVPAFLAARLGRAQALGIVDVTPAGVHTVRATRRLDGGRREVLDVAAPAVVSVEGSTARLRRASLAALLAAQRATIDVRTPPPLDSLTGHAVTVRDYRPRARVLAPPHGDHPLDRLRALTDSGAAAAAHGETVHLAPHEAALRIVATLREWGYLHDPATGTAAGDRS